MVLPSSLFGRTNRIEHLSAVRANRRGPDQDTDTGPAVCDQFDDRLRPPLGASH
jgi:hypothetical protein